MGQFEDPSGFGVAPRRRFRVSGSQAVEPLLRARGLVAAGSHFDHALPGLRGAFEVLFAARPHDADVEQRLGVRRLERQRPVELLECAIRLVHVVVGDPEVGAGVDVSSD